MEICATYLHCSLEYFRSLSQEEQLLWRLKYQADSERAEIKRAQMEERMGMRTERDEFLRV